MVHWADVAAQELVAQRGPGPHVFATAITPSGPIHVGNMREVLTTEAIFRSVCQLGAEAQLIYIADDYDPLRKVYPFLEGHPRIDYADHVGKPLKEIPCPCGAHSDYATHFLEPFLRNLEELGIRPRVLSAYHMYGEGQYTQHVLRAMDAMDALRQIIEEVSGRQLPKKWAPFNPQCPTCRRITGVEVLDYVRPVLHARCGACAHGSDPDSGTFTVDLSRGGGGKLAWRIDWPARWDFLGVTFEAFGKDHGASGGSWDSGLRIAREIFEAREPHHVMYEFLHLKGQGAMHSSTGLAVSAEEVLRMTPPEALRYLLVRQSPRKHIDFDPGLGILQLVDDFDRHERIYFGAQENPGDVTETERVYQLSCPREVPHTLPPQVNFRHLVTVVQIAPTPEGVEEVLRRSGELAGELDPLGRRRLAGRIEHARYWLKHFAPAAVRFEVQKTMPTVELEPAQRAFMDQLAAALENVPWEAQTIHDAIYAAAQAVELPQGRAFSAVYRAILGQERGPRAGFFLATLERPWVLARLREAALAKA